MKHKQQESLCSVLLNIAQAKCTHTGQADTSAVGFRIGQIQKQKKVDNHSLHKQVNRFAGKIIHIDYKCDEF